MYATSMALWSVAFMASFRQASAGSVIDMLDIPGENPNDFGNFYGEDLDDSGFEHDSQTGFDNIIPDFEQSLLPEKPELDIEDVFLPPEEPEVPRYPFDADEKSAENLDHDQGLAEQPPEEEDKVDYDNIEVYPDPFDEESGFHQDPWEPNMTRSRRQGRSITISTSTTASAIDGLVRSMQNTPIVNTINVNSRIITDAQLTGLLSNVRQINGRLTLQSLSLITTVRAPNLQSAASIYMSSLSNVESMELGNLTSVNGSFTIQYCYKLSGAAASAALPELRTVSGQLKIFLISWGGTNGKSRLEFPQLTSVGEWYLRQSYISGISMPALVNVTGQFYNYYFRYLLHFHFPSLAMVRGNIRFQTMDRLPALCNFQLPRSGWTTTSQVLISDTAQLVQMPAWLAQASGVNASTCTANAPHLLIHNAADFQRVISSSTIRQASSLGEIVITWADMTTSHFSALFTGKTSVDSLIVQNNQRITTVSPALDNVTEVGSMLAFDTMPLLLSVRLPLVERIGGTIRVYYNSRMNSIEMPNLQTCGGMYLYNNRYITSTTFPSLTSINGTFTLRYMYYLSGTAVSTGFASLMSVDGEIDAYLISWSGALSNTGFTLPALTRVGSWYFRRTYMTFISFPSLQSVRGRFYFDQMHRARTVQTPSLSYVGGKITFYRFDRLPDLCGFALPLSGYNSSENARVETTPHLVRVPQWLQTNASIQNVSVCHNRPSIIIQTAADYNRYNNNATLRSLTEVGTVVISWRYITNQGLSNILRGKTQVDSLILEGLNTITSLSPALDSLQTVNGALVFDRMLSLQIISLGDLSFVGSGLQIDNNPRLIMVRLGSLQTVGHLLMSNDYNVRIMDFGSLATVNGSFSMQRLYYVTGDTMTGAFQSLSAIDGRLDLYFISWSASLRQSVMTFPLLESVGDLRCRYSYITTVHTPLLRSVGDEIYFYYMPYLRSLNFESLSFVGGRMKIDYCNNIANLCQVGLTQTGYNTSENVVISRSIHLTQVPAWIIANASLTDATACSGNEAIIIHTEADYIAYLNNTALVNAQETGPVVISWSEMNNSALASVLSTKTVVEGLVLEKLTDITDIGPAVANIQTVTSGLIIDRLVVTAIEFPALETVGSTVHLTQMSRLRTVRMESLQSAGNLYFYSVSNLNTVGMSSLAGIDRDLYMSSCHHFSGTAITNAFPNLVSIGGRLYMSVTSWSGTDATSVLSLPRLRSVGYWYTRYMKITAFSCPVLETIGPATGGMTWSYLTDLRSMHFPSLRQLSGKLDIYGVLQLTNLCEIGLSQNGYNTSTHVKIERAPKLVQSPVWISTNSSWGNLTACLNAPNVVIHTADDFAAFAANQTLLDATELGSVVLTWPRLSNSHLNMILNGKTRIGGLVLEELATISTLVPALSTIENITSGVTIDNMAALQVANFSSITNIGSDIHIYYMPRLQRVSFPNLISTGGVRIQSTNTLSQLEFPELVNITGSLYINRAYALFGYAISNGFPNLQLIGEELYMYYVSWSSSVEARSIVSFPRLLSVGAWYMRASYISSIFADALTQIGGTDRVSHFTLYDLRNLRTLNMPSLELTSGQFAFTSLPQLTSLCHFRLERAGYLPNGRPLFTNMPHLVHAPEWLANLSLLTGITSCSEAPAVVIHTQRDYETFMNDSSLRAATELGPVVITWPSITNEQLSNVLQGKITLGGLVIEGCEGLTYLHPALDNLTTVHSGVTLDNLVVLQSVQAPVLTFIGSVLRIYSLPGVQHIQMPRVTTMLDFYMYSMSLLRTTIFSNLRTVNGSFYMYSMDKLSPTEISTGFPVLAHVQDQLYLNVVGRSSGNDARAPLNFARLANVGSMYISNMYSTQIAFPTLTDIGAPGEDGKFTLSSLSYATNMFFPVLQLVSGQIQISSNRQLNSICRVELPQSGYLSRYSVHLGSNPSLITAPAWMIANARISTVLACPPTAEPTVSPTSVPTASPSKTPSRAPTVTPSSNPSQAPSSVPTAMPSTIPTWSNPSDAPTLSPTVAPTGSPSVPPTSAPSVSPTVTPTVSPSVSPTFAPTFTPTISDPTSSPTGAPSCPDVFMYTASPSQQRISLEGLQGGIVSDNKEGTLREFLAWALLAISVFINVLVLILRLRKKEEERPFVERKDSNPWFANPLFGQQPGDVPFDRRAGFENTAYSDSINRQNDITYVEVPAVGMTGDGGGYMDVAPKPTDPLYADMEGAYTDIAPLPEKEGLYVDVAPAPDKEGLYVDVAALPDDFGNASEDEEETYMDIAPTGDFESETEFGNASEDENEGAYMDIAPLESSNTDDYNDYDIDPNHVHAVVQVTPQSDLASDVDI